MGKSVKAEVDDAVPASLVERAALVEELRREQDELAAKYGVLSDSTPLIREWRDQLGGRLG